MNKKNLEMTPTTGMSRSEWLEARRQGIGGSDAAAILGMNPYSTPYSVWADKLGRLPEQAETEAMRLGRDLEEYVAQRWMETTGKKCRRVNAILKNPRYPFALANVDREVVGENAGLECKTTSVLNLKRFKGGDFPDTYYCQCVHYMAVTGADRWYLAVLVPGREFYTYTIERDEEEIVALMGKEAELWKMVKAGTPPLFTGKAADSEALQAFYPTASEEEMKDLTGQEEVLKQFLALKQSIGKLERAKAECEQKLKGALGEAGAGICSAYEVRWRSVASRRFDVKGYIAAHPEEELEPYYKISTSRRFEIRERQQ